MRASTKLYLPTLLWALITAVGLLVPGSDLPNVDPSLDWLAVLAHFLLCGVLALLVYRSLAGVREVHPSALTVFALCFIYSGLLEVAQIWVPGRSFELHDFAVNAVGVAVGLGLGRWIYSGVNRISPSTS